MPGRPTLPRDAIRRAGGVIVPLSPDRLSWGSLRRLGAKKAPDEAVVHTSPGAQ